jgi:hypothetical protein
MNTPITTLDSYRLLGRSGVRVSPMPLGTMMFGQAGDGALTRKGPAGFSTTASDASGSSEPSTWSPTITNFDGFAAMGHFNGTVKLEFCSL